jgi:hypothetical protein
VHPRYVPKELSRGHQDGSHGLLAPGATMQKENSIFSKEEEMIQVSEGFMKQEEIQWENFLKEYKTS